MPKLRSSQNKESNSNRKFFSYSNNFAATIISYVCQQCCLYTSNYTTFIRSSQPSVVNTASCLSVTVHLHASAEPGGTVVVALTLLLGSILTEAAVAVAAVVRKTLTFQVMKTTMMKLTIPR
mmetsp:Transcript_26001/g.61719  ORF Transcript_26001/g.61719 Transcript_26001/m.61719 type:complete len:122 (+) Transcript_26001:1108-1473(+)